VSTAFEAGYRHVDTAAAYRNERGVGQALAKSGLPREEVYITTKLWNSDQGYDSTLKAFDRSMEKLGFTGPDAYLDLYLIHWPLSAKNTFVDTFKAFSRLRDEGRIKSIGVSNFSIDLLKQAAALSQHPISNNQVKCSPDVKPASVRTSTGSGGLGLSWLSASNCLSQARSSFSRGSCS